MISDYVWACLFDPEGGYYATRPQLGASGDFITSPMISQMFGEVLGLWVVQVWVNLGCPPRLSLVEIGPGDGSLMSDLHRTFRALPELGAAFGQAVDLYLIEPSSPLRAKQAETLRGIAYNHINTLSDIPTDAPVIILANEVLDCLPARQFQLSSDGWYERCVGLDDEDELIIGLVPAPSQFSAPFEAKIADVYEVSLSQNRLIEAIAECLNITSGAALFIDYGRDAFGPGDTLQALSGHVKYDPLEAPGEHDLTQWADFPSLVKTAQAAGVNVSPITPQGLFLECLGIHTRCEALSNKNPNQAKVLNRQVHRLTASDEMGTLFKVLGLSYPLSLNLPCL
jgi:NADH dehydrogenase [ubiquinone] 1 alpha subcomplex assembly factor 7